MTAQLTIRILRVKVRFRSRPCSASGVLGRVVKLDTAQQTQCGADWHASRITIGKLHIAVLPDLCANLETMMLFCVLRGAVKSVLEQVLCGHIAEGEGWAQTTAGARVMRPCHTSRAIAGCVKAGDGFPLVVDNTSILVGDHAPEGSDVAGIYRHSVIGRPLNGAKRGVRFVGRIPIPAIVFAAPALEIFVIASVGEGIKPSDRVLQNFWINADLPGQIFHSPCPLHVAALKPRLGRCAGGGSGPDIALAVAAFDNRPTRYGSRCQLILAKLHVRTSLVSEPLAGGSNYNDMRLTDCGVGVHGKATARRVGGRDPNGLIEIIGRCTKGDHHIQNLASVAWAGV